MNDFRKSAVTVISLAGLVAGTCLVAPDVWAGRQSRNVTRTSVNRNVNVNKNVNVNTNRHVDIDVDRHYHPIATAAAVTATVAVTSAIVGSIVHSIPPSCTVVQVGNVAYQQCGSTWYQPQYAGS
jgi:hypothetical protein